MKKNIFTNSKIVLNEWIRPERGSPKTIMRWSEDKYYGQKIFHQNFVLNPKFDENPFMQFHILLTYLEAV